jgi:hypothetical protein
MKAGPCPLARQRSKEDLGTFKNSIASAEFIISIAINPK